MLQEEYDEKRAQDRKAKEALISCITDNKAAFNVGYTRFLEPKMKLAWTYLFEPSLAGRWENTLEPLPGVHISHQDSSSFARFLKVLDN